VDLLDFYQEQIVAFDREIEVCLGGFPDQTAGHTLPAKPRTTKPNRTAPTFDVRTHLYRLTGVDLTRIDGIDAPTALKVVAETGLDMSRWPSDKHFASWLTLAPGTKVSGGKTLSGRTKPSASRAAAALRLAARSLHHSKSALGAFFRRLKTRLGAPKAITATAHKLARLIYRMLKCGTDYVDQCVPTVRAKAPVLLSANVPPSGKGRLHAGRRCSHAVHRARDQRM
jgi:transposase